MLHLATDWVWDSWYAHHHDIHHVWFLHAPRSLGDPGLRHHNARIGHATSPDLRNWSVTADAIGPSPSPAWDDIATWTGCVVQGSPGTWHMFYTGVSTVDDASEQRICMATSKDLMHWSKSEGPVITADGRWYETDPTNTFDGIAWRDPWIFKGPDQRWHMLITASAKGAPPRAGGVVGHAVSDDLCTWTVMPPLTAPIGRRCLEVPQLIELGGRWLLLFSMPRPETEEDLQPLGDTWAAHAAGPLGPFDLENAWIVDRDQLYAGRLVQSDSGDWALMGFLATEEPVPSDHAGPDAEFFGAISDPRPFDPKSLTTAPSPARHGG